MSYSAVDRLVHRLAFSTSSAQLVAAAADDALAGPSRRAVALTAPVFVTALPRAGTTVLLEALSRLPRVGTHRYRDMPFVMAPSLWARLSTGLQKRGRPVERAHGDGLTIDYDSPEAFEEVVWRALRPEAYRAASLALWPADVLADEQASLARRHMAAVATLRAGPHGRYVSKNNANLVRLDVLRRICPDAHLVVPVREPIAHAGSLLRQHRNFGARHAADPFAMRYMADIGHFEFGELHRPIAFPGLAERTRGRTPDDIDYWLGYWIAAYEHVLAQADQVLVFAYERASAAPTAALAALATAIDLDPGNALNDAAALFRSPPPSPPAHETRVDAGLRRDATALHARLLAQSINS